MQACEKTVPTCQQAVTLAPTSCAEQTTVVRPWRARRINRLDAEMPPGRAAAGTAGAGEGLPVADRYKCRQRLLEVDAGLFPAIERLLSRDRLE